MSKENHAFEVVYVNPWVKRHRGVVPRGSLLVCIYSLNLGVASVNEALYVRQLGDHVELWLAHPDALDFEPASPATLPVSCRQGLAVRALCSNNTDDVVQNLFIALVRSRWGHAWPGKLYLAGIFSEQVYEETVEGLEREGDAMAIQASAKETSVVRAARELRLQPEPTGTAPAAWRARCPETNHSLYISTASNSFGCGYCRRKGGEDELRAFVDERRGRRRASEDVGKDCEGETP